MNCSERQYKKLKLATLTVLSVIFGSDTVIIHTERGCVCFDTISAACCEALPNQPGELPDSSSSNHSDTNAAPPCTPSDYGVYLNLIVSFYLPLIPKFCTDNSSQVCKERYYQSHAGLSSDPRFYSMACNSNRVDPFHSKSYSHRPVQVHGP